MPVAHGLHYRMLLYKLVLVSALLWGPCGGQDDVSVDILKGIVEKTWELLMKAPDRKDSRNRLSASMVSLEVFFKRYESDEPLSYNLEVTEDDFLLGKQNWMADFGSSEEVARACFRLLNLDYATKLFLIDTDLRVLFSFLDYNWDRRISQSEFAEGFHGVLRPLPFAVMFLRHDSNTNEILDDSEYYEMVHEWDEDGDGSVIYSEFVSWWEIGGYGSKPAGAQVFKTIDTDWDGFLDQPDLDYLLKLLTNKHTASLDFDQFVMIDNIIFGFPKYRRTQKGQKTLKIHSGRFLGLNSEDAKTSS